MDETVVVTGAAFGLGAAIARAFGAEGATVVYGGPDAEAVDSVTSDIEAAGGTAFGVRADARDQFDLERLMETAAREAGPIDVLVPAAIVAHDPDGGQAIPTVSYSAFDDVIRTNLRGPFSAIREAVPHFAAAGVILVPVPGSADKHQERSRPLSIAAAGVRGLVEVAASDLDQTVFGVEYDRQVGGEVDDEALDRVANTITGTVDAAATFDERVVSLDELARGE